MTSLNLECVDPRVLGWSTKNYFLRKSAIYHKIKLPFDVEAAEKFLNGIYWTCMYVIYQKNDIIIILNLHDVAVESSLRSSGTEVYFNTFFSWRS